MSSDSEQFRKRKALFDGMLTIYGRKPVLEALQDDSLIVQKLHLADSNKHANIIDDIVQLAELRHIPIQTISRDALSRISKNKKQDQGVAADLALTNYITLDNLINKNIFSTDKTWRFLALDSIHNPQNLGMIIRSAAAGFIDYLIIPRRNCAKLESLAIKASAGTIFKCPIVRCERIEEAIEYMQKNKVTISILDAGGDNSIFDTKENSRLFILGNETTGVSKASQLAADEKLFIPMQNDVESLNVAVTAALLAYLPISNNR